MEQKSENINPTPKSKTSRTSFHLLLLLYLLVGVWVGWVWRSRSEPNALDAYHKWYYNHSAETWENTNWIGVHIEKCPLDAWTYQEVIYDTKPDVLVEAGTLMGGSAYYFASLFDLLKRGRVLTIDIEKFPGQPQHDRITYLLGSSTSDAIFQTVKNSIHPGEKVMVVLDSDHHKDHVLKELRLYSGLVTVGNYLVCEDTDINGHPVRSNFGPGPMEAVEEFLKTDSHFIQDRSREKFGVTLFPGGWLKKVR